MCGICGKINTGGKEISRQLITSMADALGHRGPDDEGVYISPMTGNFNAGLGHKRLSIIDLSKAGAQPMPNEDRTLWMVYNGEIYNYRELKKDLKAKGHRFLSDTDGEIILHLFEEEGMGFLSKINGMFSFALYDQKDRALYLCRDRLGIKPLVYAQHGDSVVFASEIKSILRDPEIPKDIDFNALNLYLSLNYIPAPHTIFKAIRKVEPGCYLKFRDNTVEERHWWQIKHDDKPHPADVDINYFKDELYHLLEDAVKMRLIADVPLGAFLSGGIDSSVVVGLMASVAGKKIKTYSVGFEDMPSFDETHYARMVAARHNTDHQEIKLNSKDIISVTGELLSWFDEPFADSSAIPTFMVSQATGKHVKVALSGDGGDELFAGYRMYRGEHYYQRYKHIPSLLRHGLIEPLALNLPDSRESRFGDQMRKAKKFLGGAKDSLDQRFYAWNEIINEDIRRELISGKDIDFHSGQKIMAGRIQNFQGDNISRMLYADTTVSLPADMLNKVDWMSMKNSLEVRVPILDHRVVELAFRMPGNLKMHKGRGKHIFLETFKDLLPPELLNRPKQGFEIPISRWLRTDLKFLVDDYLSKETIKKEGLLSYAPVGRMVSDHFSGRRDTSWQLWNLIVLQAWHRNLLG